MINKLINSSLGLDKIPQFTYSVLSLSFASNSELTRQQNRHKVWPVWALFLTASLTCSSMVNAQTDSADNTQQTSSTPAPEKLEVSLPNPLDLNALLNRYADKSPEIDMQMANVDLAKSSLEGNQVGNTWKANINGRLGRREFAEENQPYNLLALHVGKILYDFDRTENLLQSDQSKLTQQTEMLSLMKNRQRLNIVKAYLNVLLADFQYRIDNEAMAVEYVTYDKVKDRHEIGQLSDVDLLSSEQEYQSSLVKRQQAEQMQLQTRIELANVIGLPDARPDEVKLPDLKGFNKRSVKDVQLQDLQKQVLANNPQLKALQQAQQAQIYALENAKKTSTPTIRADAWVGALSSYPETKEGHWKAALSVDVPLYDGGAKSSAMAKVKAQLNKIRAESGKLEQNLRSEVSDIYFKLKLLGAEKKQHQVFGDYADLYLDFSRGLYENESSTDLGDAMVRLSEANYDMVAWRFKQALLWLQLDYLQGKTVSITSEKNN